MSVNSDDQGRRSVEAEVEIRATPEAVWKAIASGPGVASWFMAMESEFEERVGGEIRTRMGDEMVPTGTLTAWDPPNHFASEGDNAYGPNTPRAGFEWTVETKDGGTCVVRLVHSLFIEDGSWDTQLGDAEAGWPAFFHILRNYVERHAEQPSGVAQAMGPVPGSLDEAFARLTSAFGMEELSPGTKISSAVEGAPHFEGEIEDVVRGRTWRAMIRLEKPFPGTGWIGVGPISGNMTAMVSLYYYGEGAPDAGARDGAQLTEWLQAHGASAVS